MMMLPIMNAASMSLKWIFPPKRSKHPNASEMIIGPERSGC